MNSRSARFTLLLISAAFCAAVATGCNTTQGFGKDVEKLGDKIENKAKR